MFEYTQFYRLKTVPDGDLLLTGGKSTGIGKPIAATWVGVVIKNYT